MELLRTIWKDIKEGLKENSFKRQLRIAVKRTEYDRRKRYIIEGGWGYTSLTNADVNDLRRRKILLNSTTSLVMHEKSDAVVIWDSILNKARVLGGNKSKKEQLARDTASK